MSEAELHLIRARLDGGLVALAALALVGLPLVELEAPADGDLAALGEVARLTPEVAEAD